MSVIEIGFRKKSGASKVPDQLDWKRTIVSRLRQITPAPYKMARRRTDKRSLNLHRRADMLFNI